jgi:glutaredoxin
VLCRREEQRRARHRAWGLAGLILGLGVAATVVAQVLATRPAVRPVAPEVVRLTPPPRPLRVAPAPRANAAPVRPAAVTAMHALPPMVPPREAGPGPEPAAASQDAATAPHVTPALDPRTREVERAARVRAAMREVTVVMYGTAWCPACGRARGWLQESGLSYRILDIERDPAAAADHRRMTGSGTIPAFDIDGQTVIGHSPTRIVAAVRRAAEARVRD